MSKVNKTLSLAALTALLLVGAGRADDTAPVEVVEATQTGLVTIDVDGMK